MNKHFLTGIVIAIPSLMLGVWLGYSFCYRDFVNLSLLTKSQELTSATISINQSKLLNQEKYLALDASLKEQIESGRKITEEIYKETFGYTSWPFAVDEFSTNHLKEQLSLFEKEYESYNK